MTPDQLDPYRAIPPYRRELYFSLLNDERDVYNLMEDRLGYMNEHIPPNKLDLCLIWLINNKIVGLEFLKWWKFVCKGSDLEMVRVLLSIVNNGALAPLIAGRNFVL